MFNITTSPCEVNAWSEVRLPFEPEGEMLEFRQQLVAAIRAMPSACDGQLVATYTAADPKPWSIPRMSCSTTSASAASRHTHGGVSPSSASSPLHRTRQ